jgi:hypothetical protein
MVVASKDGESQGGGDDTLETPNRGGGGVNDRPARIGVDLRTGGPDLPFVDVYAKQADSLTVEVTYVDQDGVPQTQSLGLRDAAAMTHREFGVQYYFDENGTVQYRVVQSSTADPGNLKVGWNAGETPIALTHVHYNQSDSDLWFSRQDLTTAYKGNYQCYAESTETRTIAYTPGPTATTGYWRELQ